MQYDYIAMLDALPKDPKGWTRELLMHVNFGGGKGAAAYKILDPQKKPMPITFEYNTQEKTRGFRLPGVKVSMQWEELRQIWPIWIERARAKQKKLTA